jgi:hypothetical protein
MVKFTHGHRDLRVVLSKINSMSYNEHKDNETEASAPQPENRAGKTQSSDSGLALGNIKDRHEIARNSLKSIVEGKVLQRVSHVSIDLNYLPSLHRILASTQLGLTRSRD